MPRYNKESQWICERTENPKQLLIAALIAAAMGFFFLYPQIRAQEITATIVGTVTDAQKALVPGATVTAKNVATGLSRPATTNSLGEYRIEFLPIGTYTVEVVAKGFEKFRQENVVLVIDRTQRVDVELSVGNVSQQVTVTAAPPLVDTASATLGRTIDPAEIVGLPLVNRNVYTQLSLTPGVQSAVNSYVFGIPAEDTQINGGADAGLPQVSYYLDGGINMTGMRNAGNIMPNPDALEEFRVETNSYSAEYGRFSTGVVTAVTRSGSNEFHGSLFEFARNTDLNATPVDAILNAPFHHNQFGGTAGGPIRRNKAFFFFSYGGLRESIGTQLSGAVVPTSLERSGNFSQDSKIPIDPTTGSAFDYQGILGNIPPGRLDPTAQNIINTYIPTANTSGNGWTGYFTGPNDEDEYLGKADYQISSTQQLGITYFNAKPSESVSAGGNLLWSTSNYNAHQQNVNINDTKTLNSNLVNQVWLNYTRNYGGRQNTPEISLHDLGSTFTPQGAPSLPDIVVTGYFTQAQATMGPITGTNFYAVRDLVSNTKGRHALYYGAEMSLNKDIQLTDLGNYGTFTFSGAETKNAMADFVLGLPVSMEQDTPAVAQDNMWYYGLYLQDNFKATRRLTLNLGIRYDLQTAPTDPQNKQSTFVPGRQSTITPSAPLGMLFPGDSGVTRGIVDLRKHHISPRVGVIWDPFGDGKTAVRAAAGVFYGGVSGNEWNSSSNFQPFAIRQTFTNIASFSNVYANFPGGVSPFPYIYNPASPKWLAQAEISGPDLNYQWPFTYQFNAAVERQLTGNLSVTTAYVGTLGHDLPFSFDENYAIYASGATSANLPNRRPIEPAQLGPISLVTSTTTTAYHSLQITATQRLSHSFSVKGFYVFSKSYWNHPPSTRADNEQLQDFSQPWDDRGATDLNQRHTMVASGIWNMDYYAGSATLLKWIANGWQISPIVTLKSGLPLNLLAGPDVNADGYTTDRPNLVAGQNPILDPHRGRTQVEAEWFNTAAFGPGGPGLGIGPGGADGDTPRNYLVGPGYRDVDLGLFRTLSFDDSRINLQLRGEATNAFNLVSLSAPNLTQSSSAFGKITSGQQTRQIQLGIRLTF